MRTRFRIHSTMLVAAAAIAAALSVPPAEAQQFSAWSAPINLNNITGCPAIVVSPPTPDPNVNSTSPDRNDTHPAISNDGLSLYFASTRPGPDVNGQLALGDYDLWVTHRATLDACWGPPVNLGQPVNTSGREFAPNLSPDGHWLFFHSKRPSICGNGVVQELWAVYRGDLSKEFGSDRDPQQIHNLGCANASPPGPNNFLVKNPATGLLTQTDSAGPTFLDNGSGTLYLYFTRNSFPGDQDGFHIYVSTCAADIDTCNTQSDPQKRWGPGVRIDVLNSPPNAAVPFHRDTRTAIRRDGLEMILSSSRQGSLASENLWVSTRATTQEQNWAPPEPLNCDDNTGFTSPNTGMFVPCSSWNPQGPFVNSGAFDGGPALSSDGTELYFFRVNPVNANNNIGLVCSEQVAQDPLDLDIGTVPGCRDLYVSKRTYITNTVLSSSANPSVVGQAVTLTATVSSASDSAPTGTVKFSDESNDLGTSTMASGQATLRTSSLAIGSHSITGQYSGDRISSGSSGSLTQSVEYGICPLYDQTRSVKSGATFPIKLQLCDANGNDLSSSLVVVHATSVTAVSGFSGTPDAPGNANPDNDFRFDATLGSTGGYIFNLSTGGLASGTYSLQFTAGSDPVTHSVNFGVS